MTAADFGLPNIDLSSIFFAARAASYDIGRGNVRVLDAHDIVYLFCPLLLKSFSVQLRKTCVLKFLNALLNLISKTVPPASNCEMSMSTC